MSPNVKNIIKEAVCWLVIPTVIYAGYKGAKYVSRRMKEKNLLEAYGLELIKKHVDTSKELTEADKATVEEFKKELRKLNSKAFYALADYTLVTKFAGKDANGKWKYEVSNPKEFSDIKEEYTKNLDGMKDTKVLEYIGKI